MFKRILVPVDGSETSNKALVAALQLAREADGGVHVIHSLDELAYVTGYESGTDLVRAARAHADKVLKDAMEMARAAAVAADAKLVEGRGRRFGDIVAEEARDWQADLVVVGTHGRRGMSRIVLGSGAEQVVRSAPVPVLTIRGEEKRTH
jgi:nucleotide-binding universal stress UspA family protein